MYKCNIEVSLHSQCYHGKAIFITYYQCKSVALFSNTQSMCSILCYHLWPVWLYHIFPHYLINGTIFGKKLFKNTMCVLNFCTALSEIFLALRRIQQDINVHTFSCNAPIIMPHRNKTRILSTAFRKTLMYQIL
jgi:hypothetical protein